MAQFVKCQWAVQCSCSWRRICKSNDQLIGHSDQDGLAEIKNMHRPLNRPEHRPKWPPSNVNQSAWKSITSVLPAMTSNGNAVKPIEYCSRVGQSVIGKLADIDKFCKLQCEFNSTQTMQNYWFLLSSFQKHSNENIAALVAEAQKNGCSSFHSLAV